MSDKKTPAVVDFSDGHYKFAYNGNYIKERIVAKVTTLNQRIAELMTTIQRELGTDTVAIAALLVSLYSESANEKVHYVRSLALRVNELQKESNALSIIGRGLADSIIYTLSENEIVRFGL